MFGFVTAFYDWRSFIFEKQSFLFYFNAMLINVSEGGQYKI